MHNYNSQGQLLTLNIFAQSSITLTQGWTGLHICSWATTGTFILYAKLKTELPNMRTEARNHHLKISWVSLDQHCHERSELWASDQPSHSFLLNLSPTGGHQHQNTEQSTLQFFIHLLRVAQVPSSTISFKQAFDNIVYC